MADDGAKLVASLEVSLRKFERQLQQAGVLADKGARDVERRFSKINPDASGALASVKKLGGALAAAFSLNEVRQAADTFTKVQNALKVTGLSGEQLRSVYDQLFAAAQRQGTSIEATATLYGRLASAQKELGASQGDLLRFTEGVGTALRVAGTDATAASGALLQLGQALAGGTVQAEEYNSLLDGARPILQAVASGLVEAGGSVAKLTALVKDGQVSSTAFFRAFLAGLPELQSKAESATSTTSQALERLKNSLVNLVGQLDATVGASQSFNAGILSIAGSFDTLTTKIVSAIQELQRFNKEAGAALTKGLDAAKAGTASAQEGALVAQIESIKRQNPFGVVGGDALRLKGLEEQLARARATVARGGTPEKAVSAEPVTGAEGRIGAGLSRPTPVSLKDFPVVGKDKKGGGSSAETLNEYQRETEQIQKRTAALQLESTLVGQSAFAADKAKASFELLEAAKKAGLETTPALKAEVEKLSTAYAQAGESLRAVKEAQDNINELARFTGDLMSGFFSDIVSGGDNAQKALMRLTKSLADAALQAALLGDGPLASIFGTKGQNGAVGGILGAVFNGLFKRAGGGSVSSNTPYLVGERGPELMVPGRSGMVIPNDVMRGMGAGTPSGPVITIQQTFTAGITARDLANALPQVRQSAIDGVRDLMLRGAL